ncbi:copper homeostasis protein CutC [Devosia sp. SD17-2]|uniref:copper homeostasis protein CutC n=1 Tax=Devosia sp. SD17-2 TaxID=2976459 RepID=UPI0023D8B813|nr:copper homeostasis protein CutC [Devosia sp. SD17-2]WEJ34007.1 copper homeostasis protein CutC [Devosia sp. SD17-2]
MTLIEICVDDAQGLAAAIAGGADRVELCSSLEMGGLSPSPGLMALAGKAPIKVRAMIRHRPGDFVFDKADIATMRGDIAAARHAGLEGVVLGASLADGRLDVETLKNLVGAAGDMAKSLHRAFDLVPDIAEAVEAALALGFDTILTSGRALTAMEGLDDIAHAHEVAAGRITIMAGSGVDHTTVPNILARAPLAALHGSCSEPARVASAPAARLGFASTERRSTSPAKVSAFKAATLKANP